MRWRALVFDVDGTLAETEDVHRRAFNETFRDFGLDWHWDRTLYRRLLDVTGGKERIRFFIDRYAPADGAVLIDRIAAMHADKTRRYGALIAAGAATLRPGVRDLLQTARRAGLRLAVATTTSRPNVDALLAATLGPQGPSLFDVVAAGDEAAAKKPAPDIFLLALARLGLEARDCLAFEDSRNGLEAALAAGLATVVTPSAYTADQDFSGALAVLPDLAGFRLDGADPAVPARSTASPTI